MLLIAAFIIAFGGFMLSADILNSLKQYTQQMKKNVTLQVATAEHPQKAQLLAFLQQFASVSDKINVITQDDDALISPISFQLCVDGQTTGIQFSGIPSGHEFNSLVLAVLQAAGYEIKLDDALKNTIAQLDQPLHFDIYVSLQCHNCPDVVQSLNQFALLNPNITTNMIDGALFKERVQRLNIQSVPSVFLNGERFIDGKISTAKIIEKLLAKYPITTTSNKNGDQLPLQDVTVIGGGPAGISAAIYSARKGLKVTLVADVIGGQVKETVDIENFIGTNKTTGEKLSTALQSHLTDYDITLRQHVKVTSVSKNENTVVTLTTGEQITTRSLIIATGAKWRELGIPGEKENIGQGVAYCPHCDGPFFKGKHVAVIGGGNSGIEAALDLAGIVKKVTVFEFLPQLKADKILVQRAQKATNIEIITQAQTTEILSENNKVTGILYIDRATGEQHRITLDGVFVQIGLVPNSQFLNGVVDMTAFGEIIIDEKCRTNSPGIFACGDVTTVPYKQIIIAMGEGAKAALAAFDYIQQL
jgi:alkyl hydroperoxide reductase subunit F